MIYVIAPSIWGLIDLPWMSASIFQPTHLAPLFASLYNTPSCEAPMPVALLQSLPVSCSISTMLSCIRDRRQRLLLSS